MITIKVNLDNLIAIRRRLDAFEQDKTEVMGGIAGVLAEAVERGFENEADPVTGVKWASLSPVTEARRKKAGHNGKILQVHGHLADSFQQFNDAHSAGVSTNAVYATTQHFGAARGQFGLTGWGAFGRAGRGQPIPWGNIPARPIMPIDADGNIHKDDEDAIVDVLRIALESVFGD
ncbi:phage virion morphogenesis protein [Desulfovibrio sp. OttesenSCG-928-G15]|nr:phage virion morphogenesis protein [Desulfovibrio sp. OttesenSCG-928-G15]